MMRRARVADLPTILALLADDPLGAGREDPTDIAPYRAAFDRIDADGAQLLAVAEVAGRVVGTLQLTFVLGLSHCGALRGQIEAVRVARDQRGAGLGRAMMEWAISECRNRGCAMVQLTTHRTRTDAHRFYDGMGFVPSHLGYKLALD